MSQVKKNRTAFFAYRKCNLCMAWEYYVIDYGITWDYTLCISTTKEGHDMNHKLLEDMNDKLLETIKTLKDIVNEKHKVIQDHEKRIFALEAKLQTYAKNVSNIDLEKMWNEVKEEA